MDIDYTSEPLNDDFHPQNGVSATPSGTTLKAMGFVSIDKDWSINGLSAEDRGEEIVLTVLCSGNTASNEDCQHRITARITPVTTDWKGQVRLVVRRPTIS